MKLTLKILTEIQPALTKLANISFPAKRSFELMPMFEEINSFFQRISTETQKLRKKYSTKNMSKSEIVSFGKEYNDLLSTEITLKEYIPIYQKEIPEILVNDVVDQNRTLSMADFINLKEFILKNKPNG